MEYPELIFTENSLETILDSLSDESNLLVTDPHNCLLVEKYGHTIVVKNNFYSISYDIKHYKFDKVIGIGGCSALDIGRAYAQGLKFIAIPTVLSTSCISVNISILRSKDKTTRVKTVIPDKTIVSLPELLKSDEKNLKKWSASGFGDLFANISASIDFEYKNKSFSSENIRSNASVAFKALEWVMDSFETYDTHTLQKLATYLHYSSLDVIKRGDNQLSAGCEHEFYETIIRKQKYSNQLQTHGILVAIGTLITSMIFEKMSGLDFLTDKLRCAYGKVGLPVNYKDFASFGVEKTHIINALKNLKCQNSIMRGYFIENGYSILDRFEED